MTQIKYIKLENLTPSDENIRFTIDQDQLDELSESIRRLGVLEPLLVLQNKSHTKIIAGHMRYLAAKKVGLASVPCIPIQGSEKELTVIQIHENIKRIPLSHIDQATTFAFMREKYNLKEEQIAKLIGKSTAYVSQHITILNSGDNILLALSNNQINFTVARELSHVKDPLKRNTYLSYAVTSGASIGTIQQWVKESKRDDDYDPEQEPLDTGPSPIPITQQPETPCDCCQNPMKTASIHFLRVCPRCDISIKDAVSSTNTDSSP
ncbi:MAG TPA: ParB/RepB/Spo0J family partition protein [bacterium]|nr:ParB/RepB/Spo0J family partition protein [bacterium]